MQLKPLDVFAAVGMLLFVVFAALVHFDRFVQHRGRENVVEFFIYAVFVLAWLIWAWITFRKYDWDLWLLVLVGAGILLHFAGGLTSPEGVRLYDWVVFGIRFDKFVHLFNAGVAAQVVLAVFRFEGYSLGRLQGLGVALIVLGLGTVVEIAEYIVLKTLPEAGVGYYDNNLQDLIANLCGSVVSLCVSWVSCRRRAVSAVGPGDS